LGLGQNFMSGGKFHVKVGNFVLSAKFWVEGGNILEMSQFNAKKIYKITE